MFFVDLQKTKTIYELLGVPRDIDKKGLKKAFKKYQNPIHQAAERSNKDAQRQDAELNKLKNITEREELRKEYDEKNRECGSFSLGEVVPEWFTDSGALIRQLRRNLERSDSAEIGASETSISAEVLVGEQNADGKESARR